MTSFSVVKETPETSDVQGAPAVTASHVPSSPVGTTSSQVFSAKIIKMESRILAILWGKN